MQGKENAGKHFQHFRQGDFKSAKSAIQQFAKSHPLKKRIPNSSINANLELVDYYSKPSLSPEDFLKALSIANMQNEAAKFIANEDEKGKGVSASEDLSQKTVYTKEEIFNPVVEYNIAVLYSYTKNFAFAIDTAVKLLVALDPVKDSYLFFKTSFFLLDILTSVKEDDLSSALLEKIQERSAQLLERLKHPPPESEKSGTKSPTSKKPEPHYLCLLIGAYLNESSPELRKTSELDLLCKLYKAKLAILAGSTETAAGLLKGTQKALKAILSDPGLFPPSMMKSIHSHYLALIRTLKSELALLQGNIPRAISLTTKNKEVLPVHPSQHKPARFTHPIHQYNNLGVIHLKLKKYALALTYFQTAYKHLPTLKGVSLQGVSPVEYISPFRCNYTEEILYNMGIALYFLKRYTEAFEYLQQAVHTFKFNANIWHLLGLCCVKHYVETLTTKAKQERKSDVYTKLIAYPPPHDLAAQTSPQYAFKRILLAKNKPPYNAEDKMSLHHAREYFCNALYALGIWKSFFAEKRGFFLGKNGGEEVKAEKVKIGTKGSQENLTKVKLESLINLVYISLVLEDAYSATTYLTQIENEKFVLDVEKAFLLKSYQAEALILQQKYKDAKVVYQSIAVINDLPVITEPIYTLNAPETSSKKAVIGQNMIALDLIMGNLEAAKNGLESLTNTMGVGQASGKEMPLGLLLSWIYFYIRTGDKKMALELIKRRRYLSSMFNAKGSLLKITH